MFLRNVLLFAEVVCCVLLLHCSVVFSRKTTLFNFLDTSATWSSALPRPATGFKSVTICSALSLIKPHHLQSYSRPHENLRMPWLGCVCLAPRAVARSRWGGKGARLRSPVVFPTCVPTSASCVPLGSFPSQRWLVRGWWPIAPGLWCSPRWLCHHCCWHRAQPSQRAEEC